MILIISCWIIIGKIMSFYSFKFCQFCSIKCYKSETFWEHLVSKFAMNCLFNNDFCVLSGLRLWWRISKSSVNIHVTEVHRILPQDEMRTLGETLFSPERRPVYYFGFSRDRHEGKDEMMWPSSTLALATISWRSCVTAEREIRLNGLILFQTTVQNFHILEFEAPLQRHFWSRVHPRLCLFLLMFSFRWLFWHLVMSSSL